MMPPMARIRDRGNGEQQSFFFPEIRAIRA
jgi:hypothetical protein